MDDTFVLRLVCTIEQLDTEMDELHQQSHNLLMILKQHKLRHKKKFLSKLKVRRRRGGISKRDKGKRVHGCPLPLQGIISFIVDVFL